ncbi:hypothetical protein [Bacillus nitratireducens]|uniref:hypothetical protein n=1 Tax=Bacillus nitratireducens TaxID=2026193 RepID=UPI000A27B852|nr:hypothetical protein BTJ45_01332 [Bacillus mycoides]
MLVLNSIFSGFIFFIVFTLLTYLLSGEAINMKGLTINGIGGVFLDYVYTDIVSITVKKLKKMNCND